MRKPLDGRYVFRNFLQSLLLYAACAGGLYYTAAAVVSPGNSFWGMTADQWLLVLAAEVILHQLVVWLGFRIQLVFQTFSKVFGKFDLPVWGMFFFPLLFARSVISVIIGYTDSGSLAGPAVLYTLIGILLAIPAVYALYTVIRYFGLVRAMGGNYFRESYRLKPLETRGMYRFSSNVMYVFVFLGFWSLAFLFRSKAALISALFQHALIWVHYYLVEDPDMRVMYS